jgi:hypothetical protein
MSPRRNLQAHAREVKLMSFKRDHLRPGEMLRDCNRVIGRPLFILGLLQSRGDAACSDQLFQALDRG